MRALISAIFAAGLTLTLVACGDDAFSPTVENVSGSYTAQTFTATTVAGTIDLLALGAEVSVTLEEDGDTTGELFVPGGGEGGEDLEADLVGTWTLSGSTVTFNQEADTFLRDVEFTAGEDALTAEGEFSGQTLQVVLTKTD
jgi:hypothetical protein